MAQNREDYFQQLDGLRFVAIFLVMVAHYLQWQWSNVWLLKFPFTYGVTLFFVLSGFLITRILLIQPNYDVKRVLRTFYIRRFLRIFPVYYAAIFLLLFMGYENTRELFPWLVSYTINIYESMYNTVAVGNFNHFWSLAVEEQFYLIWPFLVLFLPRRFFLPITIFLIILSVAYKIYLFEFTPFWVWNDVGLITNFNSLGMGGILAYLYVNNREKFQIFASNKVLIPLTVIAFLTVFLRTIFDLEMFKVTLMQFVWVVFFTSVIARAIGGFKGIIGFFLAHPAILYLGRISYGIYIFHQFVPSIVYAAQPSWGYILGNKYVAFIVFFGITVAVSTFSWYVLERPMNRLKQKFEN